MENKTELSGLVSDGLLPEDSEMISTHNNLVVSSIGKGIVARIANISSMEQRDDPGDIRYSHKVAWAASDVAPVLRPTTEEPFRHGNVILSVFPMMRPVNWRTQDPSVICSMTTEFGEALSHVSRDIKVSRLDVTKYASDRLNYMQETLGADKTDLERAEKILEYYREKFPFSDLVKDDPALTHGDLHTGNIVVDADDKLQLIDLDSTALGPRLYDLASWRVRNELGDIAPVEQAIEQARRLPLWDEDAYRVLMGWKILSSVTHVLRYEKPPVARQHIKSLGYCGIKLSVPGPWEGLVR